jgi:hypothetical protein
MVGSTPVAIASNQSAVPVTVSSGTVTTCSTVTSVSAVIPATGATNLGKARDAAAGGTDTGVATLGIRRDIPAAETPAAGDYVIPQISALGERWVNFKGANTHHHAISAASTNATSVKASAGYLYNVTCNNVNAATRYLKLFNLASAPTVGTSTPIRTLAIPPNSSLTWDFGSQGLYCGTGISYCMTTGIAVGDTAAVAASEHAIGISYV